MPPDWGIRIDRTRTLSAPAYLSLPDGVFDRAWRTRQGGSSFECGSDDLAKVDLVK